jgi:hypothetical protein
LKRWRCSVGKAKAQFAYFSGDAFDCGVQFYLCYVITFSFVGLKFCTSPVQRPALSKDGRE